MFRSPGMASKCKLYLSACANVLASLLISFGIDKSISRYAIVHPDAKDCAHLLEDAGYELWVRETPINVNDIKKEFLRTKVVTNGYVICNSISTAYFGIFIYWNFIHE